MTGALAAALCLSAGLSCEPPDVAAPPVHARAVYAHSVVVKILSYNIKGTPVAGFEGFHGKRFKKIGEILAARRALGTAPDAVLIQESFVGRTKNLRRAAAYPYSSKGPGGGGALLNAGLYILSEHPIVDQSKLAFGKDACTTWDCMANKGAMLARIQLPGLPFTVDLYNTHLQSIKKHDAVRVSQMNLLLDRLLAPTRVLGNPMIFAGDFNSMPALPSYGHFVRNTGLANAGEDCLRDSGRCRVEEGTAPGELLEITKDQHFYAPENPGVYRVTPVYAARSFPLEDRLSDHLAYEVHYKIEW